MSDSHWAAVTRFDPLALVEARLQLHYAAQVVAAVGMTLLEAQPDDSHPNLGWRDGPGALAGHLVDESKPLRAALRPSDCALLVLDPSDVVIAERGLAGASLDEAHDWMQSAIEAHTGRVVSGGLVRSSYELPPHGLQAGAVFETVDPAATSALGSWFAVGHAAISDLVAPEEAASTVRCWPHHFDIGTLITVATDAQGGLAKSVGIGLSPGDGSFAEPYWYVTPWPYPDSGTLGDLGSLGHWHTEGFTAAILRATDQLGQQDGAAAAASFLGTAAKASRDALDT